MAICHEVAGHDDCTAFLRAQPVQIIDGHADGCTGRHEVICPACSDDPGLSFDHVPPDLQEIRGPSELVADGLAAFHVHVRLADAAPTGAAVT